MNAEKNPTFCPAHPGLQEKIDALLLKAGAQEAYSKTHQKQIDSIVKTLTEIKTSVEQNQVSAKVRDAKLEEIKGFHETVLLDIQTIQRTVDNGLNDRVDKMATQLAAVIGCLEERKKRREIDLAEYTGMMRFFKLMMMSFEDLIRKWSGLLFFAFIIWVIWIISKIEIFGETPKGFFKMLFG